jgi:amino acid permease
VLAAMAFLALGVVGDLFVVVWKVTGSYAVAAIASLVALVFFYGLWFGYSLYRRNRGEQADTSTGDVQKRPAV